MPGLTVKGDYQGREVALWASMVSGMEIISVDGREVSRKRSYGLSSTHDLPAAGIDIDRGVVKAFPLRLELRKKDELVATFKHPRAMLILMLLVGVGALVGALVALAFTAMLVPR